ncbi:MAG TPA: MFS transporter, partial [Bacteroidia bacterium]|nr:MFS transporter [Bacteroidia bacterium]
MIIPVGLLFLAELLERFTYYGVRAFLVLYMFHGLELDKTESVALYGILTGGVYFLSIVGGLLGDLTRRSALFLVIGSGSSTLGMFLLAFGGGTGLIPALCLIALGTGIFKPNMISTLYSQIAHKKNHVDGFFILLYLFINIGAFLAPLVIGHFADSGTPNYELGFLICAGVSLFNTILLLLGLLLKAFQDNVTSITQSFKSTGIGIAQVALFMVAGIVLWILYEQVSELSGCGSSNWFLISAGIGSLIFGALFAGLGFIPGFKSVYKISAGFLVLAVIIAVGAQLGCSVTPYLLSAAEILTAPVLIAQIASHVSPRFIGTFMGVYFLLGMISNKAAGVIYGMPPDVKSFTAYVFVVVSL